MDVAMNVGAPRELEPVLDSEETTPVDVAALVAGPTGKGATQGTQLGEPHAREFRAIFEGHATYVHKSLRRLGVYESDLADASQEVFVTFFRRFHDFDASRPAKLFLFGIAIRVAMSERRRRGPGFALQDEQPLVDASPLPDAELELKRKREFVLQALNAIPLDRRPVFVLHEIDGYPIPAIAENLDIPVNTAYSRLRLAREEFNRAVERLRKRDRV